MRLRRWAETPPAGPLRREVSAPGRLVARVVSTERCRTGDCLHLSNVCFYFEPHSASSSEPITNDAILYLHAWPLRAKAQTVF